MKRFMGVYLGSATAEQKAAFAPGTDKAKAGREAWGKWAEAHRDAIVDSGSPLGKTKRVDPAGISDTTNGVTAYVVVEAESHEQAAKMFENHPHFTIFPGDAVEVMECLPIPGS